MSRLVVEESYETALGLLAVGALRVARREHDESTLRLEVGETAGVLAERHRANVQLLNVVDRADEQILIGRDREAFYESLGGRRVGGRCVGGVRGAVRVGSGKWGVA